MTEEQIEINYNKYLDTKIRITEIAGGIKHPTFQYLKLLLVEKGFSLREFWIVFWLVRRLGSVKPVLKFYLTGVIMWNGINRKMRS